MLKSLGLFCLLPSLLFAEVIYVPDDQPTIQIAISEAQAGDIIILQPGTYFEAINFSGKRITIQSSDPLDSSIVASTIVDALDLGAVVTFLGNEDSASQFKGITITHFMHCISRNRTALHFALG